MPDSTEIQSLVIESVRMLAKDFEIEALTEAKEDSLLYGKGGPLDSMALVNLIADIEDAVAEKYGATITLADERALSAKRSPFRSVADLSKAIMERLPE
jgi:acyl carrier protein